MNKYYFKNYSNSNYSKDYYLISKPEPKNEKTGNYSIKPSFIQTNNHKPFLFTYFDHSTGQVETKIMDWQYVKDHSRFMWNWVDEMDEYTFSKWMEYHLATCERQDIIGISDHTLDILRKNQK